MYCRELPERGWQLLSVPSLEMRHGGYATFTEITEKSLAGWGSASCTLSSGVAEPQGNLR